MVDASVTTCPFVRIFRPLTFNTMMFRMLIVTQLAGLAVVSLAQRPTATMVSSGLIRLDLDGFHVFADAPVERDMAAIGVDDVVLFATEPAAPPAGGRTFMPSMTGEVLDRRTERLGEKTAIYVHPVPTPLGDVPHNSYLVQWNGRRMYFTGETADTKDLLATTDLDIAFVHPALMKAVEAAGRVIEARTVVVYHTTNEEQQAQSMSVPCDRCKVVLPVPGETIQLFR